VKGELFPPDLSAALFDDQLCLQRLLAIERGYSGHEEQNRSEAHDYSDGVRNEPGSD
jgi:hypothetical protein